MSSNSFLNPKRTCRSRFLNRSLALLLALVLLLALLPRLELRADAAYYDEAIQKLMGWNVMQGYPDGSLHEDSYITRAEFVALINRAYGYEETTAIPFTDVPDSAWFHDDISAAYAAGYFSGSSPDTAEPSGDLTREQAMVMLARNMRLSESGGEVTSFSDGRSFQSYSAGYANAAVAKGIISGYSDGSFRPAGNITRGEMAVMLTRALGNLVNGAGFYALGDVFGNVTINTTNVTLRDTTIAGDLYLTGGVGLGGVTLENVNVLGDIIVAGGGESDAGESVILRNVTAENLIVDTLMGEYVSLRAEGATYISRARLISDAYIQDRTPSGLGFQTIRLEGAGGTYSLSGNLENVVNAAPGSALRISQAIASNVTMDEAGAGASLWLDSSATVLNLSLDTATSVQGQGNIRKLNVNVAGTSVDTLPDEIEVRPGLTGSIAGNTMDSTAAAESSSEPHIQANYPRVINVAATSATATFSTNKTGTVYWAITSISDGSVDEESLLTPAAQSRILKSGSLSAAQSNTVYSVNITGLTPGGNYYLTAMLVDARGDYSPIKVVSFTTTDNTTPAFGSGFPYMVGIEDTYAYAAVMATKDCQLYWVVFDKGSSAPTAASFRSGAFTGAYGSGIMDMERNISRTFKVNSRDLTELTSYDVYFWLNDPDSAKSSAVRKLSFTTADRTPPEFITEPTPTAIATTSIRLTTSVNEAGTVYWALVPETEDYPKQPTTSIKNDPQGPDKQAKYEDYFRLQIVNGINSLKHGSVKVKANADYTINVTGLQPETRYNIYYIAVDNAGNYSGITTKPWETDEQSGYILTSNYRLISTKDEKAPTVRLEFSMPSAHGPDAETDIQLIFSEPVQRLSTHQPLEEIYGKVTEAIEAEDGDAETTAREALATLLRNTIRMYSGTGLVKERTAEYNGDDWVIDYRYATVTKAQEDGRLVMIVTFPTNTENPAKSALNLNSDASYYFRISDIADISAEENEMEYDNGVNYVQLDFKTRAARVDLAYVDVPSIRPDGAAEDIEIKLAYSMKPVSISKSSPDRRWDMLIFSDETVSFELYMQTQPYNEDGVSPVAGDWKLVKTVNGDPAEGVISVYSSDKANKDLKGQSFWKHLRGADNNPFIRDEFNIEDSGSGDATPREYYGLNDDTVYFFAIHILTVTNQPADDYIGTFNLQVTVDTGSTGDFSYWLGQTLTTTNYGNATDKDAAPYRLSPIEENVNFPGEDFVWPVSYAEKTAPEFVEGYPELKVTDTTLTGTLKLERKGTVWYYVAPAADGVGTRRYDSKPVDASGNAIRSDGKEIRYEAGSTIKYGDLDVPRSGNEYDAYGSPMVYFYEKGSNNALNPGEDGSEDGTWNWQPLYLKEPVPDYVFNYNESTLKYDPLPVPLDGVSPEKFTVENLQPNTEYFIYFVIAGTTTQSDNVQVYKFKTEEVYRPKITVLKDGAYGVSVRSDNMDAAVEYSIYQLDLIQNSGLLYLDFVNERVLGADYETKIPADAVDSNGKEIRKYKVYEAMQNGPSATESYFDLYADPSFKKDIVRTVTTSAATTDPGVFPITTGNFKELRNYQTNALPINLNDEIPLEGGLQEGVPYYILTVSRYLHIDPGEVDGLSGNSYSFRAYSPITKVSTDIPRLRYITGSIKVSYSGTGGTPTYSGDIAMTFDRDLYYLDGSRRVPIRQTKTVSADNSYKRVTDLVDPFSTNDIEIVVPEDVESTTASTRQIYLHMEKSTGYISLLPDVIVGENSETIDTIYLEVTASPSGKEADCVFRYGNDENSTVIWLNTKSITINMVTPAPRNVLVAPASVEIDLASSNKTAVLTATVLFGENSDESEVEWTVVGNADDNGDSIVRLNSNTSYVYRPTTPQSHEHSMTVTGLREGTVTVRAKCGSREGSCTISVVNSAPENTANPVSPAPPDTSSGPNRAPAATPKASFSKSEYEVKVNSTLYLGDQLSLSNGADLTKAVIIWESSDRAVASISTSPDANPGIVTGNQVGGPVTITATIRLDGKEYVTTVTVIVIE